MKPVLQALVLADRIYTDTSGKKIIAGTFNRVQIGKLPKIEQELPDGTKRPMLIGGMDLGSPSIYISLTDVVDPTEVTLQLVDVSTNKVVFGTGFKIKSNDRLGTIEIIAPLPPFRQFARKGGTYSFDLVWKGEILGSHRIIITEIDPTAKEPKEG